MTTYPLRIVSAALALMLCGVCAADPLEPTLKIGDPAPPIEAMAWIKGEPVRAFEPGRVYVVDFWATWCAPCKALMPHLSELQRKHADRLTVVSVNVRETERGEATRDAVEKFVRKQGSAMDFAVAMDDPEKKTLFDTWMLAAGAYSLPTTIVVDGQARVVWVGHPTGDGEAAFETAVEQALAGKSDLAAARELQKEISRQTAIRMGKVRAW